jgi:hypothetical protein
MAAPPGTVMWIGFRVPDPCVLCKARETVDIFLPLGGAAVYRCDLSANKIHRL